MLRMQPRHIIARDVSTVALLLLLGRICLRLDVLNASTNPEAIEGRAAIVTLHRFEGYLVTVLDTRIAVGVLSAASGADWFGGSYYFCTHITPVSAKREAPKHCSGLVTVVEPGCLLDQVCWYLILRQCNIRRNVLAVSWVVGLPLYIFSIRFPHILSIIFLARERYITQLPQLYATEAFKSNGLPRPACLTAAQLLAQVSITEKIVVLRRRRSSKQTGRSPNQLTQLNSCEGSWVKVRTVRMIADHKTASGSVFEFSISSSSRAHFDSESS